MVRLCMPGLLAGARVDKGQEISLASQLRMLPLLREVHPRLQLRGDQDQEKIIPTPGDCQRVGI